MIFTLQARGQTFILCFLAPSWQPLLVCREKLIIAVGSDHPATQHLKNAIVLYAFLSRGLKTGEQSPVLSTSLPGELFSCQGNLFGSGQFLFESSKVHWAGTSWWRRVCFLAGPASWHLKIVLENMLIIVWQRDGRHLYLISFTEQKGDSAPSLKFGSLIPCTLGPVLGLHGFLSTICIDLSE